MSKKQICSLFSFLLFLITPHLFGQMRMIPHLTRAGGGFTTTVIIENRSVDVRNYTLTPYDQSGVALDPFVRSIGGQTVASFPATDIAESASHFAIEGEDITVTVTYTSTSGGSPAHVEETSRLGAAHRLFAGDWSVVFDGFAAVNTGTEAADVMVTQKNSSGVIQEVVAIAGLAPNAKGLYIIGDPNGSAFTAQDGVYYEISSTQELAITALRGDVPGRSFLWTNEATTEAIAQPESERMIAHLTRAGGGFSSTVIVENLSGDEASYTLEPYAQDGTALTPVTRAIAGSAIDSFPATDLGESASHLVIKNAADVKVTVTYTSGSGGSPVHVGETTPAATSYRLFTGDWSTIFDGFAVVNTGNRGAHTPAEKQNETADIWVIQRDESGVPIQTFRAIDDLAYMAKGLFIIGDPNTSVFQQVDGSYFEVYSDQSLAITALRGNIPGSTFLWANAANAIRQAETYRDEKGIWFIEGGSLYDVIEAQGYATAEDRLFQLDLFRRNARGTLSEIFGVGPQNSLLNADIARRNQNYTEEELTSYYENLAPEAKTMVKAYVDGVNRRGFELFFDTSLIPLEILVLNYIPGLWSPEDIMSFVSSLLRTFDPNGWGNGQIQNAAVYQSLQQNFPDTADEMFDDLVWINDPDATTVIPGDGAAKTVVKKTAARVGKMRAGIDYQRLADAFSDRLEERERALKDLGAFLKMGSYAWAVAGDKTDTGNPMIYSGPQTFFSAPTIQVEGSIRGGGINVSGMAIPGAPGIIIGRTPHHAWSMQVGHAHTADLYVEPLAEATAQPHRTETINVAGGVTVTFDVFRTEHGPVLQIDDASQVALAWKYAHWGNEFDSLQGFYELAKAESVEEFSAGIEKLGVSQHFCYVDKDGNIGYWLSGRDPNRPDGEWRLPQGTLQDEAGAPIVLEYDINDRRVMPHDTNPAQGFYGGWNNKAAKDYAGITYGVSAQSGPFDRANYVVDRLQTLVTRGNVTYEEVRGLALDIATTASLGDGGNPWVEVSEVFSAIIQDAGPTQAQSDALQLLADWDGHFVDGGEPQWVSNPNRSDGWILMNSWLRNVGRTTVDEANVNALRSFNVVLHGIDDDAALPTSYDWFTSQDPAAPQSFDEHVIKGLNDALLILGPRPWGVNQRGVILYPHNLLTQFGIQTFHAGTPLSNRSTYAHCVEVGPDGPVRIESMFPLGQSGFAQSLPGDPTCNENALLGALGAGICFDPNSRSMIEFYDTFTHREFPVFD